MTRCLQAGLMSLAFFMCSVLAAQEVDYTPDVWIIAGYGSPVITNSPFNQGGEIELKVGGRVAGTHVTLVGGLSNSLNSGTTNPERFSLFIGPGYIFTDRLVFLSLHTGLSYPFYRNAPEVEQNLSWYNALDFGIRIVPKFAVGVGMNSYISNDVPAYNLRIMAIIAIL